MMKRRLRLIDAVAIAALGLLTLKGLSYLGTPAKDAPRGVAGVVSPADQLPAFGRVLAHARSNYIAPDVDATGGTDPKDEKKLTATLPPEPKTSPPPAFEPVPLPASPAEKVLLERLGERRDALQQRSRELELRERLLENTERKLETRINDLRGLEEKAGAAAPGQAAAAEAAGLKNLVTMYETMKPKDAARVFDRLAHDVLVPVVLQMNPRKMAEVLAVMSPEAAEKLTVALAMRARGASPQAAQATGAAMPANELPAIVAPPPAQAN